MDEQNLSSKTTASRELRTIVSAVGMSYCLGRMSSDQGWNHGGGIFSHASGMFPASTEEQPMDKRQPET